MSRPGSPPAFGHAMRAEWALDPDILYLNHGTVGAPPRRVLQAQQAIRDEIERQPSRFLLRELSSISVGVKPPDVPRMRAAANAVAAFLGARGEDLVFVDNVTSGVNAVLRSLEFLPDDEIVVTSDAYGAVVKTARYVARRAGAHVRVAELPDAAADPQEFVEAIAAALTPRTRVAIIEHVAAESALVLPLAALAARCQAAGVMVLADGAHAPGAIPVDLPALGVDWYAANLHKWAWSPRSCGILWAPPERQADLHPPVISWGLDQGFADEFDWTGTRDPSAALAAPVGIAFMQELGVDAVRAYNHALAWDGANRLAARWGTSLARTEPWIGTMATIPLPTAAGETPEDALRLRDRLLFEDHIEAPIHAHRGRLQVRISAQIYNETSDLDRLAEAVERAVSPAGAGRGGAGMTS
ncbi:MAG: aminotransferase class V-fold PLP-dependent enzyme [Candidatus Eisenbacteria bacterium]